MDSRDRRFDSAYGDVWQHRINNRSLSYGQFTEMVPLYLLVEVGFTLRSVGERSLVIDTRSIDLEACAGGGIPDRYRSSPSVTLDCPVAKHGCGIVPTEISVHCDSAILGTETRQNREA